MVKKVIITILVLVLILGVNDVLAKVTDDLQLGVRPQGLGGAFTAIADDANAVYWNPAGLYQLSGNEITLMHYRPLGISDIKTNYLAWGYGLPRVGFGIAWRNTSTDLEQGIGATATSKDYSENEFMVGIGIKIMQDFAVGLNFKRYSIDIENDDDGAGFAFDLGTFYEFKENWRFGLVFKNVAADFNNENIDMTIRAGVSYIRPLNNRPLLLAFELETKDEVNGESASEIKPHIGAEYFFTDNIGIRLGLDDSEFAAGFGLAYSNMSFDYAYVGHDKFDATHKFAFTVKFGGIQIRDKRLKQVIEEGAPSIKE